LVDAGAEFFGYGSDITRTWPSNGKFTDHQRTAYNIVLAAQNAALSAYMPGVPYGNATTASTNALLQGLLDAHLVYGTLDALRANRINSLFLPHGIRHQVGLDVHDPEGSYNTFAPGMLLTCEPGLYFIPDLLNPAFTNPAQAIYLNIELIKEYMTETGVGGYRIEDLVYITPTGQEILSLSVPRTVSEIEGLLQT